MESTQGHRQEIPPQCGGIKQTNPDPYSLWWNQAEPGIGDHKKQVLRILKQTIA